MNRNGILTCPRCGRVLMGMQPCPNCTPVSGYASYSAESYGYTAQSNAPRWLLLAGALLLLGLLIAVVSLRQQSASVLGASEQAAANLVSTPAQPASMPAARPTPESAEERAFWRRKTERELREVGEYHPTEEEKAAQEAMRWQDHAALSNQSRTTDYYVRRPELVGGRH